MPARDGFVRTTTDKMFLASVCKGCIILVTALSSSTASYVLLTTCWCCSWRLCWVLCEFRCRCWTPAIAASKLKTDFIAKVLAIRLCDGTSIEFQFIPSDS